MLQRWHKLEVYATKMAQTDSLCYKDVYLFLEFTIVVGWCLG